MDNNENKDNYRITEMIMINPFGNWSFTFIGTVRTIKVKDRKPVYFGVVDIDQDTICCLCNTKDDVAPALEFIYTLKFHPNKYRHRFRLFKTLYAELVMN